MTASDRLGRRGTLVGGLWMVLSQLVPLVFTLALSVTMGRVLGPDLLGEQSFIAYVQSLLVSLLVVSVTSASIQVLSADLGAKEHGRYLHDARWSYWAHALSGVVSALVLVLIGLLRPEPLPWMVVAIASLADAFAWALAARVISKSGWRWVSVQRLIWQSMAQVLGIAAVLAGLSITGVFAASAIAAVCLLVVLLRASPRIDRVPAHPFPRVLLRITSGFFVLALLAQVVNQKVEFLFLDVFSTSDQLAMYSIAFMLVSTVALVPVSIAMAGMPTIAAAEGAAERWTVTSQLGPATRITITASLPLAAAVATLGPRLIVLLYGDDFLTAASLVPLLAVTILFVPTGTLCSTYWSGIGRMRPAIVASIVAGILDLAAAWTLVPRFGAAGAAIANVIGQVAAGTVVFALTWQALGRFGLGASRRVWGIVVSALTAAIGVAALRAVPGWPGLVVAGVGMLVLVAGLSRLIGLLSVSDGDWLAETLPHRLGWVARLASGRS